MPPKTFKIDLVPVTTKDGKQEYAMVQKNQELSFDEGFFLAVRAIQVLLTKNQRIVVVGVAGPSGAGKTSLAQRITEVIPGSVILSMDNYLDATRRVIDDNFDDSRLVDFDLIIKNVEELRAGKETQMPLYDFRKSGRYAYKPVQPPTSKVLVVEGTYALHENLRPLFDLMISVSGGVHNDLIKRVLRDIHRTGQDPQQAIQQITETVYPMYKAFIEPDLKLAHIRVVNRFNPFSALVKPMYILKTAAQVDTEKIQALLGPGCTVTEEKSYDIYLHPPEIKPEGCRDWIRVRNNAGSYSVMFSEDIKEGDFIISPRIDFVVNVKILAGLMALGYKIGAIINRTSKTYRGRQVAVSLERLEQLGGMTFLMVKGGDRHLVAEMGSKLGLDGTYENKTFIELYQEKLKAGPIASAIAGASAAPQTSAGAGAGAGSNPGAPMARL